MPRSICLLIVLTSHTPFSTVPAVEADLPSTAQRDLEQYHDSIDRLLEEHRAELERERERVRGKLERELQRATRRGELDAALAIRKTMNEIDIRPLDPAQWDRGRQENEAAAGTDLLGNSQRRTVDDPRLDPEVVEAMRAVHLGSDDQDRGSVAQLGDGLLVSRAVLTGAVTRDRLEPYPALSARIARETLSQKGPAHGNGAGLTMSDGAALVEQVLDAERPEIAVIHFGHAELTQGPVLHEAAFRRNLGKVIRACLDAGCIPVLLTTFPHQQQADEVELLNGIIRRVAERSLLPLVDYHAAVLERRPDEEWVGTLVQASHDWPTSERNSHYDFSEQNLNDSGLALLNHLLLETLDEICDKCLDD